MLLQTSQEAVRVIIEKIYENEEPLYLKSQLFQRVSGKKWRTESHVDWWRKEKPKQLGSPLAQSCSQRLQVVEPPSEKRSRITHGRLVLSALRTELKQPMLPSRTILLVTDIVIGFIPWQTRVLTLLLVGGEQEMTEKLFWGFVGFSLFFFFYTQGQRKQDS